MRKLLAALAVAALALGAAPVASAAELPDDAGVWTATINGQNVDRSGTEPVRLEGSGRAEVVLRIENRSDAPVVVPYLRLQGAVLGLTLYAYTTRIDLEVPPGEVAERPVPVDLLDLGKQANGLIPSQVLLLDGEGAVISAVDVRVDVRGRFASTYGLFGLAIGLLTLALLVVVLWKLAKGRLSPNRWRRGLAVAAPGLGLGFLLTFTLSALRWATPEPGLWASLLLGGLALGFMAGYLSPTPDRDVSADGAAPAAGGSVDGTVPVPRIGTEQPAQVLLVPAPPPGPARRDRPLGGGDAAWPG